MALVVAGGASAAVVAAVVGSALVTPGQAGSAARTGLRAVPGSYVALGDSYTSGPALPVQLGPTTTPSAPSACQRSSENYPSVTARALGLALIDASCGGATTGDLTGSQGAGIPAQLSALRATTSLVSIGIGGNDLGFSTIVANCAAATPWGATRVGWSCARHYAADGADTLTTVLSRVRANVAAVLGDVRDRAPLARVFVIGYPEIIPPDGPGCWPELPFSDADLGFLRGIEDRLNAALAGDADSAGDTYVDMATPSDTHSACSSDDTRWVEPVLPSLHTYPLHPSGAGMAGMAHVLEAAIRRSGAR